MRLLIANHFQNAYQSLRSNRMRTSLTMIGVAIGVASITAILSLGSGATRVVGDQVEQLGGNIAVVRPGVVADQVDQLSNPTPYQSFATSTLNDRDVATLNQLPLVKATAPLMVIHGSIQGDSTTPPTSTVVATTPSLADIAGLTVRDGQFIDSVTNRETAVIGPQLSIDLFGTDQSIGKTFKVRDNVFTVIGILKRSDNPINFNTIDFDKAAIISLDSGRKFNQGVAQIQQINIQAASVADLPTVLDQVNTTLLKNHGGERDFTVLSGSEIAQPTSQFFFIITGATTVVALISLIVGGIGIMNILLVSVAERTREIGLRKALGASNGHIIWQFLIESLAMSIGGSVIGYVFGYLIAFAVSTLLTFTPVFTWQIALAALGISIAVGTLFGLYPALRAARKDPIEALRHYY